MTDSIRPAYYQVGDIDTGTLAGHLTFFAGSAVKYLVRACRIDGVYKTPSAEGRIQDLEKAREYIGREAERIALAAGLPITPSATEPDNGAQGDAKATSDTEPDDEAPEPIWEDAQEIAWGVKTDSTVPSVDGKTSIWVNAMKNCWSDEYPDAPITVQVTDPTEGDYAGVTGWSIDQAREIGRIFLAAADRAEQIQKEKEGAA